MHSMCHSMIMGEFIQQDFEGQFLPLDFVVYNWGGLIIVDLLVINGYKRLSNSVEFEELVEKDIVVTERINTYIENHSIRGGDELYLKK